MSVASQEAMTGEGVGRVRLRFLPDGPEVQVPPGVSLFDAASWNGVAIDSTCGGYGTCKKCKVRIVEGELPISSVDPRAFTPDELRDGWRLACRAQASCDLVIDVPPLQTRPKAATVGVGRQVILRPSVQKRYLELSEPTLQDQVSDLERILAAMDDLELRVGVDVVRTLPQLVRASDWKVTAVVVDDELIGVEAGDTTGAHVRHRVRPRHDDGRRDAARSLDRDARRRALDPQPPAALRRRRHPPHLRHDDGSDGAAEAAGARAGDARRPRRRGAGAGRGGARGGLRGRARRQRDDDAAPARHRSRAGRRGAVHHGRVELPAHARDRLRRDGAPARARARVPGARRLRRRRHRLGPAGLGHDARQAAAAVHRRRHELRDRARQRRAAADDGRARRAGLRGRADPLRHARRRRRRSRPCASRTTRSCSA